jgi:hypothetical protein
MSALKTIEVKKDHLHPLVAEIMGLTLLPCETISTDVNELLMLCCPNMKLIETISYPDGRSARFHLLFTDSTDAVEFKIKYSEFLV